MTDTAIIQKNVNLNFTVTKELNKVHENLVFELNVKYDDLFSNAFILSKGIDFLIDDFIQNDKFKIAPTFFFKTVTKMGRRKKTERTPNKNEGETIHATVSQLVFDNYINLMYSYYIQKSDFSIQDSNSHLSSAYLFYDFMELLLKNKKAFFSFIKNNR